MTPLQGCRAGCDLKKSAQMPTQIVSTKPFVVTPFNEGGVEVTGAEVDACVMVATHSKTEFRMNEREGCPTILCFRASLLRFRHIASRT